MNRSPNTDSCSTRVLTASSPFCSYTFDNFFLSLKIGLILLCECYLKPIEIVKQNLTIPQLSCIYLSLLHSHLSKSRDKVGLIFAVSSGKPSTPFHRDTILCGIFPGNKLVTFIQLTTSIAVHIVFVAHM